MPVMQPTDSNFERTFSDLAFVRLKDKAPTLLDHLIGFQLIDKNEEETHAVGVFGFKVGDDWVYAPVFFINGELKGYELLYLKSQDAFVPLTEEWINYILNRKPSVLGTSESRKVTQQGIRPPDFDVFARPPYIGSKYASAKRKPVVDRMQKWAQPFLDVFLVSPKDACYSGVEKSFSLPIALKRLGDKAAACLFKTMEGDSKFAEAVLHFYKAADLANFSKAAAAYEKEEAGYTTATVMRNCQDCVNFSGSGSCSMVKGDISKNASCKYWAAKLGKEGSEKSRVTFAELLGGRIPEPVPVVIIHGDDTSNMELELTESDREKLMKDKYVVKDPREPGKQTRAYKSQLSAQLSSPSDNGIYTVLGPGGECREVVILRDMLRVGMRRPESASQFVAVIDQKSKAMGKYYNSDLLTTERLGPLSTLKDLTDPADVKIGDKVFLVDPARNKATNPFCVDRINTDSDGITTIEVCSCYMPSASASPMLKSPMNRTYPMSDWANGDESYIESLILTGKEGTNWRQVGNALFVPASVKACVVKSLTAEERKDRSNRPSYVGDDQPKLELATSSDILYSLSKAAAENRGIVQMQMRTDGTYYWTRLNGGAGAQPMNKLAMLRHLIVHMGLGQKTAEDILSSMQPRKAETYWLRKAAQGEGTSVMTPSFEEPTVGQEAWTRSAVQYPMTRVQNLSQNNLADNRSFYQNLGMLEDDPKAVAMQAANEGQKEVLDTAVISGLVKLMDTDTRVDSYIGDLLLGLDRLGRILFMYYWHNDKFSEHYGQEDMSKLEDSLRNVFASLGELTLFLKQKTIDSGGSNNAEAELTSVLQ
jgi:hypothetical protein